MIFPQTVRFLWIKPIRFKKTHHKTAAAPGEEPGAAAFLSSFGSLSLQRQQAEAVVAARKKIVEGAVGMVEMALGQLNDDRIVDLDEERKAAMVSNLLVVLCGNHDAQPVVNSGSLY